jgi:hypothetical protein
MTLETFEKAKELREDIDNLNELDDLFKNLFVSRDNSLSVKWGNEVKNTVKTCQIPEELREQILEMIVDYRNELEYTFLSI